MNNFLVLLAGEMQRMKKYNLLSASLFIAILWVGVMHFTDIQDVSTIFPLLIYLDATSMALLMIGVTMFFEKQEGTIKTLLVTPISKVEYILAKAVANIFSNLFTLVMIYAYAKVFKEVNVNILGLIAAVILIAFFHSLLGFLLTYYSKDFTSLLVGMMKYAFIFMIPVLIDQVGLIQSELYSNLLYALPTKASITLLNASVGGMEAGVIYLSIAYLIIASILTYLVVVKKFDEFALKESGV